MLRLNLHSPAPQLGAQLPSRLPPLGRSASASERQAGAAEPADLAAEARQLLAELRAEQALGLDGHRDLWPVAAENVSFWEDCRDFVQTAPIGVLFRFVWLHIDWAGLDGFIPFIRAIIFLQKDAYAGRGFLGFSPFPPTRLPFICSPPLFVPPLYLFPPLLYGTSRRLW